MSGEYLMIRQALCSAILSLFFMGNPTSATAGAIIGGSNLLDANGLSKLEGWLGEGPLMLTNIFDHVIGDGKTSFDFHSSADGKGRTFAVMKATDDYITGIVGGYNDDSWSSGGGYSSFNMTSFLFNISNVSIYRPTSDNVPGIYHAINNIAMGPSFGSGFDLAVNNDLNSGYSYLWSYGAFTNGRENYHKGTSLVSGANWDGFNMTISYIEVFSIATFESPVAATPEPGTILLMGVGVAGASFMRRRAKRS